jgi:hypothetical protein
VRPVEAAAPSTVAVEPFKKSRREADGEESAIVSVELFD